MSDLVAQSPMQSWGHIVTIVFLVLFVGIIVLTYWPGRRREMDRAGKLPLDDGDMDS